MTRLDNEYVGAAHILENLQINFAVAEAPELHLAKLGAQVLTNTVRQRRIRRARKNLEAIVVHSSVAPLLRFIRGANRADPHHGGAQSYNKAAT